MFDIGSYVIYRSEGVCVVSDIREENFGIIGKSEKYYILAPINAQSSTVFVPVNNEVLTSYMRPLLSAAQINAMAERLRAARLEWIDETRTRNNRFKEILAEGDPEALVLLVNSVSERIDAALACGKKPSTTDLNALRRAEKMLYDQFVSTTDLTSSEEILPLLRGEIKAGDRK